MSRFFRWLLFSYTAHAYLYEEEYDFSILDPNSVYGSPYGGFSRAVASRLSKLPLLGAENDPEYTQLRDHTGKLFACRLYDEDDLHPDSRSDGLFQVPRLHDGSIPEDETVQTTAPRRAKAAIIPRESTAGSQGSIEERLVQQLEGICGQLHKGWWSYEWCFGHKVRQFHVEVDPYTGDPEIQLPTSLGVLSHRTIVHDFETVNELAEDTPEVARILEHYHNGDPCENGQRRETVVELQCCSPRVMNRRRSLLHRNQAVVQDTNLVAVVDLVEDEVCQYKVTACAPVLCGEEETTALVAGGAVANGDEGSIQSLLYQALGEVCLQTITGGWWTYELCHGVNIRQYHEILTASKTRLGITSLTKTVEAEHSLGEYQGLLEHEEDFVVNATALNDGPYFQVEYTGGSICDHTDVTGAAIVAGSSGTEPVMRASSVRYRCGEVVDMNVHEDHTCHYIVDVRIPELCAHPVFRTPVEKKKIYKCLEVDESP